MKFRKDMRRNIFKKIHVRALTFLLLTLKTVKGTCSNSYGSQPCNYVPAPPGRAPPCARPGDTFCEHVEQYPMQHIRLLIDKWGFDYATLFNDESQDDYNSYFRQPDYSHHSHQSDYNHPHHHHQSDYNHPHQSGYNYPLPEPIYIPKPPPGAPQYHVTANGNHGNNHNRYVPPSINQKQNYSDNFAGYPNRRYPLRYSELGLITNNYNNNNNGNRGHGHHGFIPTNQISYYDPNSWWRYNNKNFLSRSKRHVISPENVNEKNVTISLNSVKKRGKRQVGPTGPQQLCPTTSQYIMPRAALNNQGNWMYIVNIQQQDNRYTQLVRSETCASSQCNGLCSVPTGYTARCEQRYVQKRLVALEGAGQNLYTDIFWFPSCCICTFTTN